MKLNKKDLQQATGAILTSFVAMHYLEEVKHLPIFKQSLKRSVNNTIKELQKVEKDYFDKVDAIDDNEIADKLSSNLMSFIAMILKDNIFIDFATLQEILMAYNLEPKAIKGISDKIHKRNNAELVK